MTKKQRALIEGNPVLIVVDIQGGESDDGAPTDIPLMPDYDARQAQAPELIAKARECDVPIIFFQEAHRRNLIDFGRELDGAEDVHLLEEMPALKLIRLLACAPMITSFASVATLASLAPNWRSC